MPDPIKIPSYRQIPKPTSDKKIFKLNISNLKPTQMCVGLSEVWARKTEFSNQSKKQILSYLHSKPIPIVADKNNNLWMLDRHHRLRALIEINRNAEAFGYLVAQVNTTKEEEALKYLNQQGWVYLYNSRGIGPQSIQLLPNSLLEMDDDPYRSLVWKLKKEGVLSPQSHIPYHEFCWSRWLRTRPLPPFNSKNLYPALSIAKQLVCSQSASHLVGWKGEKV